MRNQTSFRLTTTLLPSDTTAKTTQVINKLDQGGNKFYPTFTEETVVLTNDDRTVMETTRATCNNGVLTFVKRGLSDDVTGTPRDNRKLTWNPGTLCFITAGASDWIDKDDNITWTGDQTYTGDLISTGSATYRGALVTEKGVQYPHFDSVSALEACTWAFGGMFAVVDSTGELYRYNAVTQEWSVVESSTPTNPEMADTTTIGTVRVATDTEFNNGTATGSHGECLVATPAQIQSVSPTVNVDVYDLNSTNDTTGGQAIVDALVAGLCPVVRWNGDSGGPKYYYLSRKGTDYGMFYITVPKGSSDSGGAYICWQRIIINFTSNTLTSIVKGETMKVYVSSIPE